MAYEIKRDGRVYITGGMDFEATSKGIKKAISDLTKANAKSNKELAAAKKNGASGGDIEAYNFEINRTTKRINDLKEALNEVGGSTSVSSSSRGIGTTTSSGTGK